MVTKILFKTFKVGNVSQPNKIVRTICSLGTRGYEKTTFKCFYKNQRMSEII